MQTDKVHVNPAKRIARIVLKVVLFLILFVVVLFLLLLTPPVQKFATGRVENFLEKKLKTRVEIGGVSIGLPRKVVLNNIYLEDQTKDTLIYGGTIKANIELFKLISGEVKVNDLQLKDITAKVKRILPDTAFNFQFIVDAFAPKQTTVDTTQTAQLKLAVNNLSLDNFRVIYKDVITGNDMLVHVDELAAKIDTLNPYDFHFDVPSLVVNKMTVRLYQSKPLVEPEPLAKDVAEAAEPIAMKLNLGKVTLNDIDLDYGNDVSAFYTNLNIGHLEVDGKNLDLQKQVIHLDELTMNNTLAAIRLGKNEAAKQVAEEIGQEVQAQQQQNNWVFRVDNIELNNNTLQFDNDNMPKQSYGMDYAHLRGDSLTLHLKNLVFSPDSIGATISKGQVREKSGFQLDALEGDILYAQNQTYLKNLLIQTPGTKLQRNAVLEYESYDALAKNFAATVMDIELVNSYVQVKDILIFAPQLRTHPAFTNRNDVWHLNIRGSGNMDRLHFETLQFDGLKDTRIDASGTLASLTNPNTAGGTFTIRRFHTSQTDISLFTGQRLSTPQINLPETFDITGTVAGNASNLATNLNLYTSAGSVSLNGRFANLTKPAAATYNAAIRTNGLQLGSILRNPGVGVLSAQMNINGRGFTPDVMDTRFKGTVYAAGFNNYTYRNISLDGSLRNNVFAVNADSRDPNADLTASITGSLSANPSYTINAMVDSVKAHNLGFATQPLIFHGKIDGNVAAFSPEYLDANIMVTNALFVSGTNRLPLDTVQLISGRTDTSQFIRLTSDIANAEMQGQYRFAELGSIIQHNIQPYFSVTPGQRLPAVQPYNLRFRVDVGNSPALAAFMPGLNIIEPIHAEGSLATGQGLQAIITSPALNFQTNEIRGLNVAVNTTERGLQITGNVGHLKSGNAFNIYNTQLTATALNNVIDFALSIDDKNQRDKYFLSGIFRQPATGTYALELRPDSLLLNYARWTVSPGNQLVISPTNITANNFILQKGDQRLALQSGSGSGAQPLNVQFTNFQIATIMGFMQSDSLLVNGTINGGASFRNLMQQPLFTSDLTINDLSLKQDTIGNINVQVNNTAANQYNANITLSGRGNDAQITGSLTPQGKDIAMDLNVAIRQIQLNTLEGAAATAIRNMDGAISGNIKVGGTTTAPDLNGRISFNNATFNTVLLGGDFRIDNETIVAVSNEGLEFNKFTIRDTVNNALTLDGTVATSNFINYKFDLDVDAEKFRAINTTKKDNKLYYGDLVLSTNLHIGGTETSPSIDGSVSVDDETNFSIVLPQAEPGVVQREGVVEFVDFDAPQNDSLFLTAYDSLNKSTISGINISTNINLSKEAVFNVIVDAANGDFLNMRGAGQLSAGIDPSGKISLTGQYEIEEGAYQISFNFLQRKFNIQKGSKIIWLGEPTNAQLDVTAVYIANTAPINLVGDQLDPNDPQRGYYQQKLPFNVLLNVDGELMKPLITFDIVLPEEQNYNVGAGVEELVRNRLAQMRQESSELNKQVFAILLLNRFVGENPFKSEGGGGGLGAGALARQSASKLLTEQLNNLAGNLIEGVDINFDVESTADDYSTGQRRSRTDLNVGLSKRLLNDRLTVTVGSNFNLEGANQANQQSNNIAGNVSLNYQLSRDGRYALRFYRRNEYEQSVEGYVLETGVGFIMNVDYNRFRQIFEQRRIRREQKKAEKEKNSDNA